VELGLGQVEGDGARWVLERVLAVRDLGRVRSQAICFFARFRGVFNRLDKKRECEEICNYNTNKKLTKKSASGQKRTKLNETWVYYFRR
jgi:hypothetical protein